MKLYKKIIALCVLMVLTSCSAVVNTDESSKDKINITDGAPVIEHEDKSIQKNDESNDQEKTTQFNLQGETYLEQEKYVEALDWFEKSFIEDPEYLLAHYNYAKTLGMLMEEEYPTWFDRKQDMIEHLKKVVEINPEYIKHIEEDAHFDIVRREYNYLLLIGLSIDNSKDANSILQGLDWYILGEGVVPVIGGITFNADQTFSLWYYPTEFWKEYDTTLNKLQYHGRYDVDKNKITLRLDEKMLKREKREDIYNNDTIYEEDMILKGVLSEQGSLIFDIFDYNFDSSYPEFSA